MNEGPDSKDEVEEAPEMEATYAPSMLDLVRLSRRPLFPPGGEELYRQIALLTGMKQDSEVLDAACGVGVTLGYFVEEFGAQGYGVDFDAQLVEQAEERARDSDYRGRLQFQQAPLDRLPYRDDIFDVAVGELGLAAHADPAEAVRELVRVTKPGGHIVLIQLVWKAPVDLERRRILTAHLGAHPLMLVEWKRLLREANVENLHTEAWSDEETAFRPRVKKPFPDFAELFTLPEKLGILRRAWGRWGWSGVRTAMAREAEVHRLLTRERILGLDLVIGRKGQPAAEEAELPEASGSAGETEASDAAGEVEHAADGGEAPEGAGEVDDASTDEGEAPEAANEFEDAQAGGDAPRSGRPSRPPGDAEHAPARSTDGESDGR